MKFGILRLF